MERKISLHFLLISLISSVMVVIICCFSFYISTEKQVYNDLQKTSQLAEASIDNRDKFKNLDTRITLISSNGDVIYDNIYDVATMDNHSDRKEIKDAFKNGEGIASRESETLDKHVYYYAKKINDNLILRVSTQTDSVYSIFTSMLPLVLIALLVVFAVCAFFATALTKTIVKPIKRLSEVIDSDDCEINGYEELVPFIRKIKSQRDEIKKQFKKVENQKEKITTIVENMAEGLILFENNKNAVLINDTAKILLGTDDDAVGEKIYYITRNPKIIDCVIFAENGKASSVLLNINGRKYQFTSSPVFYNKKQNGLVCLIIDVTEKVGLEKMRQEFTANVSHELKTPLTSVMGYAELIENEIAKPKDIPDFASKIRKEASRMLNLISDILNLSKLDEMSSPEEIEQISLKEISNEVSGLLSLLAENYNVKLNVSGDDSSVMGNKDKLSELVYNLCENAIRYNTPRGKVDIIIENNKLIVQDTGIGIPKDKHSRVFERFYRVDKSRSKQSGGTGLGLAIVKHIAGQHNASVYLESELNKGTKITVEFPK